MKKNEVVCVICPQGCTLTVAENSQEESGYLVEGHKCKKGIDYGIEEVTNPTRNFSSTVYITGSYLTRLPVKTSKPVPKGKIMGCMREINKVRLAAPVNMGDIIIKDILGTGTDIVATRSLPAVNLKEEAS